MGFVEWPVLFEEVRKLKVGGNMIGKYLRLPSIHQKLNGTLPTDPQVSW